ncbi:hypothetical protein [Halioglobus sp. HI00S01]|uniref:hypothetical protein n=1 Tax=Halioglobus sp. HI00S01 TaxID=1822214 RepID=UPI0012E812F5|nr:hypothetical protein [Halioglobus sp. HI00S01]
MAILDAQLEAGTGDFDAMILEEQDRQRSATRSSTPTSTTDASEQSAGGSGGYGGLDTRYPGGEVADASSTYGGGMGGIGGGQPMPENTARFPPPEDIPSGDDDDVVARQLREAAMREADPAVREKLWDEYRKYKGISQ